MLIGKSVRHCGDIEIAIEVREIWGVGVDLWVGKVRRCLFNEGAN